MIATLSLGGDMLSRTSPPGPLLDEGFAVILLEVARRS
jgi:hypothetical protein